MDNKTKLDKHLLDQLAENGQYSVIRSKYLDLDGSEKISLIESLDPGKDFETLKYLLKTQISENDLL